MNELLQPAVLFKNQIIAEYQKRFYAKDMFYETAGNSNWIPDIKEEPDDDCYQYAIVDENKLIGFICFQINWYVSCAYCFGLMSFDKGNYKIGKAVRYVIDQLVNEYKLHRIEWRVVCGNPVEKAYDRLCKEYGGNKMIYHDSIKNRQGVYINEAVYEIILGGNNE